MAQVELIMPKMGESIMEATILNWVKKEGDEVEMDETILEIATDKVDSEVPSPVAGRIAKILFPVDETVEIGKVIAIIETEGESASPAATPSVAEPTTEATAPAASPQPATSPATPQEQPATAAVSSSEGRFYSPLVRNIAKEEGIAQNELDSIAGSGKDGRVTKKDILAYVSNRSSAPAAPQNVQPAADSSSGF